MSTKNINFIDRVLEHQGLVMIPGDGNMPHQYMVKEGYKLPVTAYKLIPGRIGYTKNKLDCTLPQGSFFWCADKYCREIQTDVAPIIDREYKVGNCFGKGCMDQDLESMRKKDAGWTTYEL